MNNKNWLIAALFIAMSLAIIPVHADLVWSDPSPANNSFRADTATNGSTATFNVSSANFRINNTATVFEWTNETGLVANVTPTQITNSTFNYTYVTLFFGAGRHQIKAYVNQSANNINGTFANGEERNITVDIVDPTVTIEDPVAAINYRRKSTDSNQTIHLNFTTSDSGLAGLSVCLYDILGDGGTASFSTFTGNTTVTCGIGSLGITPRNGGNSIVELYINDSAGNNASARVTFSYGVDAVGGGSSPATGGGGSSIRTTTGTKPTASIGGTGTATGSGGTNNNLIIAIVVIALIWYFVFRKKKRK